MGGPARPSARAVTALLRPATRGDLASVAAIEKECFTDPWSEESFRRLLGGQLTAISKLVPESSMSMFQVRPAIFLVAESPSDSSIAGYVVAFSVDEDGEILNVAVESRSRGKGLAGQMLDATLIEMAARGVRTAFLEVRELNVAARGLYGSRGFIEIGRRRAYYRRPVEDALVMRRVLRVADGEEERSASGFADR